jgi:hypothetical protein
MTNNDVNKPEKERKDRKKSQLKSTQKHISNELSYNLKYAKKDKEDINEAETNFLNFMKEQYKECLRFTYK